MLVWGAVGKQGSTLWGLLEQGAGKGLKQHPSQLGSEDDLHTWCLSKRPDGLDRASAGSLSRHSLLKGLVVCGAIGEEESTCWSRSVPQAFSESSGLCSE